MQGKNKQTMLVYGDSPISTTGLGRLHKYLLKEFQKDYDITIVALNHADVRVTPDGVRAIYDQREFPYKMLPTYLSDDLWGIDLMKNILKQQRFDIIFTSHDINRIMPFAEQILEAGQKFGTKWVMYTPIDRLNVLKGEEKVFALPDATVFYSKYALDKFQRASGFEKMAYIYLPLDLNDFPELPAEDVQKFRDSYFVHWKKDDWLVGNINRNQFRKDLGRTCYVFKKFLQYNGKAKLYLHTKQDDEGGDITITFQEMGLTPDEVAIADFKNASTGMPQSELNKVYRNLQLFVSTSKGEGFGYPTVEAMATKTPVLVPDNTSFTEIVGANQERGYLAKCSDWVIDYGKSNCQRMIVDTAEMLKQMIHIYNNSAEAKEKAERAYTWVAENLNISKIAKQWAEILKNL